MSFVKKEISDYLISLGFKSEVGEVFKKVIDLMQLNVIFRDDRSATMLLLHGIGMGIELKEQTIFYGMTIDNPEDLDFFFRKQVFISKIIFKS